MPDPTNLNHVAELLKGVSANAEFIAAARTLIPQMATEIVDLRRQRDSARNWAMVYEQELAAKEGTL